MSASNGQFTDIALAEHNTGGVNAGTHVSTSGPWTQSTDAYSRKHNRGQSNLKQLVADRSYCVFVVICAGVFVVGFVLGLVIGTFVITRAADDARSTNADASSVEGRYTLETTTASMSTPANNQKCTCNETPTENCRKCPTRNPYKSTGNETNNSPFAPLTIDEMDLAIKALQSKGFVVGSEKKALSANRVAHMFLLPVEKSRVLDYLDNNGPFPGRYAQVNVVRGAFTPPDFMEYKVGPLNETLSNILIEKLRSDGEIHFNRRPFDMAEYNEIMRIVASDMGDISDLLKESFDGASYTRGIGASLGALPSLDENDRLSTIYSFLRMGGYNTIRIIPVSCIVHHPGTNTSTWYASDFYYASQGPFSSGMELQTAYINGSLRIIKFPQFYREEHNREFDLRFNSSLPQRHLSDLPPPQTYEPKGPRYTIKGHAITWMDWEFRFSSNPLHGPAIFDVKFKTKRIAYEISLQDVTLIYSSQTNGAGPPALSDVSLLLGNYNPPRSGLDCPSRSSILTASKYFYGYPDSLEAACVFEADGQRALWRYKSRGLADHHLIIRASMNLGNYDYTMEWKFFLDGSLETLLTASGFLFGAFWDPDDPYLSSERSSTPFGYRISDYQLGPIHNHNYVFKVDLDILGTNNSFQTIHWRAGSTLDAFQTRENISTKPGYFYFNNTRYLEEEIISKEDSFITNPLKPKYFTVVNENERNVWGNKRGYRIVPYSKSTEILQEHLMLNAWDDLKFMLAVTKRKHSEQYGTSSTYDLQLPLKAFKGVGRMLDNETVRHEDIVLWVSEQFLHAPSAEDLPMTLSVPSGFMLKPYNYFDRTPVFDVQAHYLDNSNPYVIDQCYEDLT